MSDRRTFQDMVEAVRAFHEQHDFRNTGGEDLPYRVALMAEELGEISACVTKGRDAAELAEECADLLILLIGTGVAAGLDLEAAFTEKMERLGRRDARMIRGRIRVSDFGD